MKPKIISIAQIRAARALLRWTALDLAGAAGVGVSTIRRIEVMDGAPLIHMRTLLSIQSALEAAGIEFIDSDDGSCGVVLHKAIDS